MPIPHKKGAAPSRATAPTSGRRFREEPEDDMEESPRSRRGSPREEPSRRGAPMSPSRGGRREVEPPARPASRKAKKQGWDSVVDKKEEMEAGFDEDKLRDFFLMDGETAIIQYVDEEPYAYDSHRVQDTKGKYQSIPCQLEHQKHCLVCRSGEKTSWAGALRVLDYRGKWDKDKKEFKWDAPQEKLHSFGIQFATQLKAFVDKKRKKLSDLVIEITKSGSGKTATYNLAIALDEDDRPMYPIEWESAFGDITETLPFKSDEDLARWGY